MSERSDTPPSIEQPEAPFWFEQPNWKPFSTGSRGGPDGGHPTTRPHFELDGRLLHAAGRELLLRARNAQDFTPGEPTAGKGPARSTDPDSREEAAGREDPIAFMEPATRAQAVTQQDSVAGDTDEDEFTRRYREEWERELAAHPSHRNMPGPPESPRRRAFSRSKRPRTPGS